MFRLALFSFIFLAAAVARAEVLVVSFSDPVS